MPTYQCETNLALGQDGVSDPAVIDTFRDVLNKLTGGAGAGDGAAGIDVDPLTNGGLSGNQLIDGLTKAVPDFHFAYGSGNRVPGDGDEFMFAHLFGMDAAEFMSWWYVGSPGIGAELAALHAVPSLAGKDSGEALYAELIALYGPNGVAPASVGSDWRNVTVFPINVGPAESGGWYPEAVTLKKFQEGKWADGRQIKIRHVDETDDALIRAFPNIQSPSGTSGISFLQDAIDGVFNCGENQSPLGDIASVNGLFPNWPDVAGSIIEAGIKHYYVGSWQTPYSGYVLLVNKPWYDALGTQLKASVRAATVSAHMQNFSYQNCNQDAIIKRFQELGGVVHESLPSDVLRAVREGTDEIYKEEFGGKGVNYAIPRDHQRSFIRKNAVRWRSANVDRRMRFESRPNYKAELQPDVKL